MVGEGLSLAENEGRYFVGSWAADAAPLPNSMLSAQK